MGKLMFGCNKVLPEGVLAAWGCRAIYPDDIVHDRVDSFGEEPYKGELLSHLRRIVLGTPFIVARSLADTYRMTPAMDDVFTLYEDSSCIVKASPQSSYGYLYVAAWLKRHDPSTPQAIMAALDKEGVFPRMIFYGAMALVLLFWLGVGKLCIWAANGRDGSMF